MIFVNTSLDVALERNSKEREVYQNILQRKSWEGVQSNIGRFQNLFGISNIW